MNRIYLSPPHMGELEQQYIKEAFDTNWIAPVGPNVDALEQEFANLLGLPYTAAVSSGTAGLHLALRLLNIHDGDVVFCSDLTFAASANAILYERAKPVFIDSDKETWNMNPEALEKAFIRFANEGRLPKAVIVVDLYGQSADYSPILKVCKRYRVPVVEDAAESLGATYDGKKCGTFGTLNVFSFNGNKIITTSGGGMIASENEEYIEKARFLATQARDQSLHYQHSQLGYNYRMSNILAGIGRGQLRVLEDRVRARRRVFNNYYQTLSGYPGIEFMPESSYGQSTRWLTVLTIDPEMAGISRTELIEAMAEENIETRPVWKPMHLQPLYNKYTYITRDNQSISEQLFKNGLCLPSGSNLTEVEQERVLSIFHRMMKHN